MLTNKNRPKMAEVRNDAMIHCQGFATDRMIFRDDELSYALGGVLGMVQDRWNKSGREARRSN